MDQANNTDFGEQRRRQLLAGVPFFNEVSRDGQEEFSRLEQTTRLWVAGPGEKVIRAGDVDSTLFFLLRGQLEVLSESHQQEPVYCVSPGEVFGTLSMLMGTPRSATIKVSDSSRQAVLASLDFNDFNDDDSAYSLATRLAFFRMIVHHIRWTLEVKRMQAPAHHVVQSMRKLPVFNGEKNSLEELAALKAQALFLAQLLCSWNGEGQASTGAL